MLSDAFKSRCFRFWSIGLLMIVSTSVVFVIHIATGPSEPFVSVSFVRTNVFPAIFHVTGSPSHPVVSLSVVKTNEFPHAMKIEVTNRMSFSVDCWIVPEVLLSEKWEAVIIPTKGSYQLAAHSQQYGFPFNAENDWRFQVSYARQLRTFEKSILNKVTWLQQHYPFQRRRSFTIYDPVTDVQASSQSKEPVRLINSIRAGESYHGLKQL
jgi:hypothetical protein